MGYRKIMDGVYSKVEEPKVTRREILSFVALGLLFLASSYHG